MFGSTGRVSEVSLTLVQADLFFYNLLSHPKTSPMPKPLWRKHRQQAEPPQNHGDICFISRSYGPISILNTVRKDHTIEKNGVFFVQEWVEEDETL